MPQLIKPNQSAFIAGCSITDNVLMAQELVRGYGRSSLSPGTDDDYISMEAISILDKMKQLKTQLEPSELKLESSISIIGFLCEELHSRKSTLKPFLQQLFLQQEASLISNESNGQRDAEESSSKALRITAKVMGN
ncbi:hypothetical protein PTKIN_Ptkin02bG0046400 [Pterospermum kingtungense]